MDFSSTILIYFSTFAVVGTLSGKTAKYSNPPTASNFPSDISSAFTVIISIGSALLYKFVIWVARDSFYCASTIKVPDNVIVKPIGTPIFGGVENRATQNKDSKITIHVNYTCIFGGIEIR